MTLRERIEGLFETQVADLSASREFQTLESGSATPADYDRFLGDVGPGRCSLGPSDSKRSYGVDRDRPLGPGPRPRAGEPIPSPPGG